MRASTILSNLRSRGVTLSAAGSTLTFDAPAGELTDADRAALREHKAELLALLAPLSTSPAPKRRGPKEHYSREPIPTVPCAGCGGRVWRLRETPQSAGDWLWVCAACADAVQAATENGQPKKT
jgi:hypothetical protein